MNILLQAILLNQTLQRSQWQGLQEITKYLEGPTLVYHDGSHLVNEVIRNLNVVVVSQTPIQPTHLFMYLPKSAVLIGSDPEQITANLRSWPIWQSRVRILVVVERESDVHAWLKSLWTKANAVNVVAMVFGDEPEFFTWYPYQKDECSNVETIIKLNSTNLYPSKIYKNLNGCPIKAVTSTFEPMVASEEQGVEPRLYHDLAKKLNFNSTFVKLPEGKNIWMYMESDGITPANAIKMLWDNQADLVFGNMERMWVIEPFAEFLRPHTEDQGLWYIPGPLPAAAATSIYRTFTHTTWALVLITFALIYLTELLMPANKKDPRGDLLLQSLAITLNLPARRPYSRILRFLCVIAYFYSLHITTTYQSALIIILSDDPRPKPIKTWEDLAESNLKIIIHAAYKGWLATSSLPVLPKMETPGRNIYTTFLEVEPVAAPSNTAMYGPKLGFVMTLRRKDFHDESGYPKVLVLKDVVQSYGIGFAISKGHPMLPILEERITWLVEGGFPKFYLDELLPPKISVKRVATPYGMESVQGPFVLLFGFLACSLLVWIGELICHKFSPRFFKRRGLFFRYHQRKYE